MIVMLYRPSIVRVLPAVAWYQNLMMKYLHSVLVGVFHVSQIALPIELNNVLAMLAGMRSMMQKKVVKTRSWWKTTTRRL